MPRLATHPVPSTTSDRPSSMTRKFATMETPCTINSTFSQPPTPGSITSFPTPT